MKVTTSYIENGKTHVDHVTNVGRGEGLRITPPKGSRTDLVELHVLSGGVVEKRKSPVPFFPPEIRMVTGASLPIVYQIPLDKKRIATLRIEDKNTQEFFHRQQ